MPSAPSAKAVNMAKKRIPDPAPRIFEGLILQDVAEVDIQVVGPSVWCFMRRKDGSIVRVWINNPDATVTGPLRVVVEGE